MGVHGLWDLLSPVGRRVSVETLAGKRLAIDASIWLVQFVKAMRDERGEMVRNAHLLGFFRRICKLLFLRTKPVFVFDGGTPALKRRTVIARRRQRENAQAKVRKTAEKLLLNQLKAMGVKELAKELESQKMRKDRKGKKVIRDEANAVKEKGKEAEICSQEMVDEMLAASLAAEEHDSLLRNADAASTSSLGVPPEDVNDENEIILPFTDGNVDPAVLASLPPSMQLDLLVQMRERLMAENRQKYQQVKKAPQRFSELQIEAYLKTVAFRREIDEVQKAAAGKGVGGMQTARIASEADREFIFSSSFTGDKQLLTSAAVKNPGKSKNADSSLNKENIVSSASKTSSSPQTYKVVRGVKSNDHRPPLGAHVSRRRAMGIHMTRDLQRNLDLMKEYEQGNVTSNSTAIAPKSLDGREPLSDTGENSFSLCKRQDQNVSVINNISTLEISFEENELCKPLDGDDEFFVSLAAGAPVNLYLADDTQSKDQNLDSSANCEWEEGIIRVPSGNPYHDSDVEASNAEAHNDNDEDELEWQDGTSNACVDYDCPVDLKAKSRGSLEEEAALQEAIRRSLEDSQAANLSYLSDKIKITNETEHLAPDDPFDVNNETSGLQYQLNDDSIAVQSSSNLACHVQSSDGVVGTRLAETADLERRIKLCATITGETMEVVMDKHSAPVQCLDVEGMVENAETCAANEESEGSYERICDNTSTVSPGTISLTESTQVSLENTGQIGRKSFLMCNSSDIHEVSIGQGDYTEEQASHTKVKAKAAEKELYSHLQELASNDVPWSTFEEGGTGVGYLGTGFEDELQNLGEELANLEDEQRKLERNADFLNSEMFVECQELLHMFGIPYIIAPMEAEAQCAYMECADLVDGVVTDDSDVFLFGARSVYKNIFDDRKYVETYFMKDMEDELGLTREKLIRIAMLLGSDYTEGVSGIGIVNAIEVVNAFPDEDGLSKFREWIESPDPNILSPWGMQSKATSNNSALNTLSKSDAKTLLSADDLRQNEDKLESGSVTKMRKIFMNKHRNVSKNWHIPSSFPSQSVVDAYKSPQVDKSTEPFSWEKPDLFVLRRFSWEKFGWDSQKVNELLLPVLQEYNKRETQLRLEAFYSFNERFAKIRSKRIKQAVKGLTINSPSKKMHGAGPIDKSGSCMEKDLGGDIVEQDVDDGNKVSKRKGKAQKDIRPSEENSKRKKRAGKSIGNGSARRTTRVGSGKRKAIPVSESCDSGQSNADNISQVEGVDGSGGLRRSKRSRKSCKYTEDDKNKVDEIVDLLKPTEVNNESSQQESDEAQCFKPDYDNEDFDNIRDHAGEASVLDQSLQRNSPLNEGGLFGDDEVIAAKGLKHDDSDYVEVDGGSYLKTGGGFCVGEDDETNTENNGDGCVSVSDVEEEVDDPGKVHFSKEALSGKLGEQVCVSSDFGNDLKPEAGSGSEIFPNVNDSVQAIDSSLSEAFRAMPHLRRKRKS